MAVKSSKNQTLQTISATTATVWDTSSHSVGSQYSRCSQPDDQEKEEEEEMDGTSPAEASLGVTMDGEVVTVQPLRFLKLTIGMKKVMILNSRETITGEARQVPSPAAIILLDTLSCLTSKVIDRPSVTINIGKYKIKALVDTGSSVSLCNDNLLSVLNISKLPQIAIYQIFVLLMDKNYTLPPQHKPEYKF